MQREQKLQAGTSGYRLVFKLTSRHKTNQTVSVRFFSHMERRLVVGGLINGTELRVGSMVICSSNSGFRIETPIFLASC